MNNYTTDFSEALAAVKYGATIYRLSWGRSYVVYKPGYKNVPCNAAHAKAHGIPEGTSIRYLPYLEMKTPDGDYIPWVATQDDILAEDWGIIE